MDVTSLCTYIPQEGGINIVCKTYEIFRHQNKPPIPTLYLRDMLFRLTLKLNSLHFNGKNYLQTHGNTMGTKMAVSFVNIFMAAVEIVLNRSDFKPLAWKRYIDDVFFLWNITKEKINSLIELANSYHPTIKFTAETGFS